MRNIWIRIGLGALAIFAVGMIAKALFTAGRDKVVDLVDGDGPIPIPLMGVVPFQLGDARLGDLRRVTLLRDAPHHISGVKVVARIADSASIEPLKDCDFITLEGLPESQVGRDVKIQLNEGTRFRCLIDSAGFASFGTIEIRHTQGAKGDEPTTLERTLILTPEAIAEIQRAMGKGSDSVSVDLGEELADSIQRAVEAQVQAAERGGRVTRVESGSVPAPTAAPAPVPVPPAKP